MGTRNDLARPFIFYVATLVFFSIGGITAPNIGWYQTLALPSWMIPDSFVAVIWGILVLLSALSLALFWDRHRASSRFGITVAFYAGNALLILLWNFLFFGMHALFPAFIVSILAGLSVVGIIIHLWRIARPAALLMTPYLAWMVFAIYLNYIASLLNT